MLKLAVAALVASVLVSDVMAQEGGGRRGGRGRGQGPGPGRQVELKNFDFQEVDFDSKNLTDGKGRYGIYLPKGWNSEENKDRKYPLVVWLHGFGGYYEFQGRGGAAKLDELRGKNEIPEMAIATFVAPGGRRGRSVYVNGEQSGKVEDAIVVDLLAHAQKQFPVSGERAHHAIMGISIGGFGALKIAMKHPDVFAAVGAHSSAIFPDDPTTLPSAYQGQINRAMEMGLGEVFGDPIDKAKWAAEMPMGLARTAAAKQFEKLAIYFDAGTEDRYGFAAPNQDLDKLMTEKGIAHTFKLIEGGGHAWSSDGMLDNLAASLKFVGKAIASPDTAAVKDAGGSKGDAGKSKGDGAGEGRGK